MGLDGTKELKGLGMGTVLPKQLTERRVAADGGDKPVALQENAGLDEQDKG